MTHDPQMVERAKQEGRRTELVRFVQEAICNRKGLRIVRLSDGIEAAKDAIAAVMSSWTDRDMRIRDRLFPAGSITVVDVLDHAAFAASETALEASHHTELVEALVDIRDAEIVGSVMRKDAWETLARLQRRIAREALDELGLSIPRNGGAA